MILKRSICHRLETYGRLLTGLTGVSTTFLWHHTSKLKYSSKILVMSGLLRQGLAFIHLLSCQTVFWNVIDNIILPMLQATTIQ